MGLTVNQQELIKAISHYDLRAARKCALNCVNEDTTQKNQYFCKRYKKILETGGINLMEVPYDLEGIIYMENVSNSFKESRYYLSPREKNIFDNIVRMKKVNEKLLEMGISYINSILLYGESGTGKTTFGKYVAYKTGLPFCYLNFSSLIDSYMGNTSKNISKAFNYVKSTPCVFMLDEIDCISIRRSESSSSGGTGGEMARITISLMQEFDKLSNDVIVIGATNRKDRIDEALLRRFSMKHEVTVLNENERLLFAKKFLDDVGVDFSSEQVNEIVKNNENQSIILNSLIRLVAQKIYNELD